MLHISLFLVLVTALIASIALFLYFAFHHGYLREGIIEVFILYFTNRWYGNVVGRLSKDSRMLDIGSGITSVELFILDTTNQPSGALTAIIQTVLTKPIHVVCIEGDDKKFKKAVTVMRRVGLGLKKKLVIHPMSVYEEKLKQVFAGEARFDAVCFSTPLMTLPDPGAALRVAASLLKEGGVVFVPQVAKSAPSMILPFFKFLRIATMEEVTEVGAEAEMEVYANLPAVGVDAPNKKPRIARILALQKASERYDRIASELKAKAAAPTPSEGTVRSRKQK